MSNLTWKNSRSALTNTARSEREDGVFVFAIYTRTNCHNTKRLSHWNGVINGRVIEMAATSRKSAQNFMDTHYSVSA